MAFRLVKFLPLLALSACTSIATELPEITGAAIDAERAVQSTLAFEDMAAQTERLYRVAAPILSENTALCPRKRRNIGVRTHDLKTYSKAVRETSAPQLGARDYPTVLWVAAGSDAAQAGVMPGAVLLDPDDEPIAANDKAFLEILSGDITEIRFRIGGEIKTANVSPRDVCGYALTLSPSSAINAYATGRSITVTTGMMNFIQSDNELALVLGHELAHNTMGHIRKVITNLLLSGFATRYTRQFESEADYVGLYYMVRAGFDPDGVEQFWRRLGAVNPKSLARAKTHPSTPDRFLRIAAARQEILEKQAIGLPLIPNMKPGKTAIRD